MIYESRLANTVKRYDVAIVGAGHGGAHAAIALRQAKFAGSIALFGAEPEPPYERPPLSKDYLAGEKTFERILIRPAVFWAKREVDLLTGRTVATIDAAARTITDAGGTTLGYGSLMRGDPAARSFSLIYLKTGRVIALDCVNSVKDYVKGKRLIASRAAPDVALLADVSRPLNSLF